ncbi:MAG: hypothetical protein KDA85_20180, partial [Planctomycetaceae bacterium]|nr:hypothetical protein [Planctomycetaceae bacterium]
RQIVSSGNSYSPATDWAIGDYRVWVRGIDATGRPARWAAFRDVIAGQPPVIVQPPGSTFSSTPEFEWQAVPSAVTYELLLINRNTGAQIQETGITATSFTVSTPLSVDLWAWHVLAVGTGGVRTVWSAPVEFYIGGRPSLLTPGLTTNDTVPTFSWIQVVGADHYELWVDQVGGTQEIIHEFMLSSTSFTPSTSLTPGTYRAWVRAISLTSEISPWSRILVFDIVPDITLLPPPDDLSKLALVSLDPMAEVLLIGHSIHRADRRTSDESALQTAAPSAKQPSEERSQAPYVETLPRDRIGQTPVTIDVSGNADTALDLVSTNVLDAVWSCESGWSAT